MSKKRPWSICGMVRRDMDLPGETHHWGRGSYELFHEVETADELMSKAENAISKWENRGILQSFARESDQYLGRVITVVLDKRVTREGYYRTVVIIEKNSNHRPGVVVSM